MSVAKCLFLTKANLEYMYNRLTWHFTRTTIYVSCYIYSFLDQLIKHARCCFGYVEGVCVQHEDIGDLMSWCRHAFCMWLFHI